MKKIFLFVVILLATSATYAQSNPYQKKLALIDRYIDGLMKEWNIPGLSLGIVYKDQVIYAKGYGYRDLENKLPVDKATLFPIASNTKLFTATAACILAGEDKLSLDKPVKTYLPSLNFYNDELNAKVTIRDMLSHRTGLPRYDDIWVASPFTRKEVLEKVAYMKPTLGFREGYIYNNVMFAASGIAMESVTNMSWEDIIRKNIFEPLQMKTSCFTQEEMMNSGNFSYSYFEPDSSRKLKKLGFIASSHALCAAGTIKSSAEDMSHWMIAQLNGGRYQSQQAIPEAAIKQTLTPINIADKEGKWDELSNPLYGLGRITQTYKGYKTASHTGSVDGFYSNLTFLPTEHLAVFVIHNSVTAANLRPILSFPIIDRLLGLSLTPWSERYMSDYVLEKANSKKYRDSISATQVKNTTPSHALKDYVGTYASPLYGELTIALQNDQLLFSYRNQQSQLHHFHYDQFITQDEPTGRPDRRLNFIVNNKGEVGSVRLQPIYDPVAEFVRKP